MDNSYIGLVYETGVQMKLKAATVVQQIMTGLSEPVSEKDTIIFITKMALNETKWLLEFIGGSKSQHLTQMVLGGSAMSSVNSYKTYIQMSLCSQRRLKPHDRLFIPNYHFYWIDRFPGIKGIPRNHAGLCYMSDTYTRQRRRYYVMTMTARVQLQK
jgi:hypothetical protein